MSDFNPDEYIAKKAAPAETAATSSDFDPDKYLADKTPPESLEKSMVRGALRYGAPVAGGLIGSAVGTPLLGGALGYAAGSELGRLGEHYLLGDSLRPESAKDATLRVAGNLAEGTVGAAGLAGRGPILQAGKAAYSRVPEIAKDAGAAVIGDIYERMAGNGKSHGSNAIGSAILRRLISRGLK